MVICAGAQRWLDISAYETYALDESTADDPGSAIPTFSADGPEVDLGEGAAVCILKRLDDARRDRNVIRGIIRGIGAAADGRSCATALREAIRRALAAGGVRRESSLGWPRGAVVRHGPSTPESRCASRGI